MALNDVSGKIVKRDDSSVLWIDVESQMVIRVSCGSNLIHFVFIVVVVACLAL